MKLLITGVCGFVGRSLAEWFHEKEPSAQIWGMDNLIRPGSETNVRFLKSIGVKFLRRDVRHGGNFDSLPAVDWVVDAAANPSVLAGLSGDGASRLLLEHNLWGSVNTIEYCRRAKAGLLLLSTSRVYSISALNALPMTVRGAAFSLNGKSRLPAGVSSRGLQESFSTDAPISLYGSTKLASEILALEYGETFGFPVWIDRCGVLAGAGQFGTAEQGIFSYWIHAYSARRPLKYIGFDGKGHQVRDALHPNDLAALLWKQMHHSGKVTARLFNVGGGTANSMSLAGLTAWCEERLGPHKVARDGRPRPFDIPWLIMDSARAEKKFSWKARFGMEAILEEILAHAKSHPGWLKLTQRGSI